MIRKCFRWRSSQWGDLAWRTRHSAHHKVLPPSLLWKAPALSTQWLDCLVILWIELEPSIDFSGYHDVTTWCAQAPSLQTLVCGLHPVLFAHTVRLQFLSTGRAHTDNRKIPQSSLIAPSILNSKPAELLPAAGDRDVQIATGHPRSIALAGQITANTPSTSSHGKPRPKLLNWSILAGPDNLVPALKKKKHNFYFWALFSATQKSHNFEHLLGKPTLFRNNIGTTSENLHFFNPSLSLSVELENGYLF